MQTLGRNQLATTLFVVMLLSLFGHVASSQTARTIKVVVPVAPGGGTDMLPRLLAEQIGRMAGPTMVIENRPGAGTVIGTEAVARAAPDGSTLLTISPPFVVNAHLRKLNYDPLTSFEPICYLANTPNLIVVNNASPYRTLADLLNAARGKPGDLTMAGFGPATAIQIGFDVLKRAANVDMNFVPYPGTAPAISALLGGHVTSVLADYPTVVEQLKAGTLRALASASRERIETFPDIPTVAESGFKEYELPLWYGMVAPAKTPKETISELASLFTAALRSSAIKPKLAVQGLFPVGICGADFDAFIRKKYDEYGRAIREANIKIE